MENESNFRVHVTISEKNLNAAISVFSEGVLLYSNIVHVSKIGKTIDKILQVRNK